jgi:cytochrome c-type biogenesis protein CcmF
VKMAVGDSLQVGDDIVRFAGTQAIVGPNFTGSRGRMELLRAGRLIETLEPEKRLYTLQRATMTEAAIRSGVFGDLYVSLGEPLGDGAWSVRVYAKPFVNWIWGGCLIMACGGLLALTDRRYRLAARISQVPVMPAVPAGAPGLGPVSSSA